MFKLNTEMEAIPVTAPEVRTVFNPNTNSNQNALRSGEYIGVLI